ncbi:hypothetical protein ACLQ24_08010 [Micromonospora sp. DT4]|uniref:hypothetical protein n=1 Tax=Micromonospora sp. DT4 TaxID=3393438 RepID=UPI003CECF447
MDDGQIIGCHLIDQLDPVARSVRIIPRTTRGEVKVRLPGSIIELAPGPKPDGRCPARTSLTLFLNREAREMQHETLTVAGIEMTRFWHCFGTERHRASEDVVVGLLRSSGTNVLPINTHRLDENRRRDALEHGFDGVSYDRLGELVDVSGYVKMLNINLRTSAEAAVEVAKIAFDMTGERVLKLEVLEHDLRGSRDFEVVRAAEQLSAWEPSLVVLPLLSADPAAAHAAVNAGCPLLRIMGSKISSGAGIADEQAFKEIASLPTPMVLDGGIGSLAHLDRAVDLGADGALVNSILFDDGRAPVVVMTEYADAAAKVFRRAGA